MRWIAIALVAALPMACDDASTAAVDAVIPPDVEMIADAAPDGAPDAAPDAQPPPDMAPEVDSGSVIDPPPKWPMWTGDEANSRANPDDRTIDASNVDTLAPVWALSGPGATSTPIVVDGVVYTGLWDGRIMALEAVSGAELWAVELGADHVVNASLALHGDTVFATTGGGDVVAVDRATGEIAWRVTADDHMSANLFSSPTVVPDTGIGDLVIVGVASTELTLALPDYTFRGSVVAYDAATGDERWRFYTTADDETSGAGVSVWSSAVVDRDLGLLYIGTGNTYEEPASPYSDALLALRVETGELAWHRQFTEGDVYVVFRPPPQGPDADIGATPNLFVADGRPVVGVGDKAGVYAALDRATGETVWSVQTEGSSPLGGIMVSAAVADGVVFLTTNLWVDVPNFESDDNTAVALALDADDGEVLWRTPLYAPSFGAVSVVGDLVWLTTVRGAVHALDRADGREVWRHAIGESVAAGVTATGGWLFAGHGFSMFKAPRQVSGGFAAYALPAVIDP